MRMLNASHPDPAFTPLLSWGEPIPMLWQQPEPGLWRVWPPCQLEVRTGTGTMLWRREASSIFVPEAPFTSVAPGSSNGIEFGWNAPHIGWGDPVPSRWTRDENGRASVQVGTVRARLPQAEVHLMRGHEEPLFFYPGWAGRLQESGKVETFAKYNGGSHRASHLERHWARPAPGHRWTLGTLMIQPAGLAFVDAPDLLPLELPTAADIEAAADDLTDAERARGDLCYLSMIPDLARSEELMAAIGDDRFSAQVQRFLADHDFRRRDTGACIKFTSDRNYGRILAALRRYGEHQTMYISNWAQAKPADQRRIKRMFEAAGYAAS